MARYEQTPGIQCRTCGCRISTVITSQKHEVTYHGKTRTVIKRYRRCRHCQCQFTTVETYEDENHSCLPELPFPVAAEDSEPFTAPAPTGGVYYRFGPPAEEPPDQPKDHGGSSKASVPPKEKPPTRQRKSKKQPRKR